MNKPCENCKYADIASQTRTIEVKGITLVQKSGGVKCTNEHIREVVFTNGKMVCSGYEKRQER